MRARHAFIPLSAFVLLALAILSRPSVSPPSAARPKPEPLAESSEPPAPPLKLVSLQASEATPDLAFEAIALLREEPPTLRPPTPPADSAVTGRLIPRPERLKERGGVYGYTGPHYDATLHRGWMAVSAGPRFEGLGQGVMGLRLERVAVGDLSLAEGGAVAPVADPERRRVSYARGPAVEERYTLRPDAVEQDVIVRELPNGPGEIVATWDISSNLQPPVLRSGRELTFTHEGRPAIELSQAVAIDAAGRRLALDMTVADGRLSIAVPGEWVAAAALPITIDPVIGSPVLVHTDISHGAWNVEWTLGAGSPEGTFLAVWYERFGADPRDGDIYGQRLSLDGGLVGAPLALATSGTTYYPTVSYAPDVNRWLVAWSYEGTFGPYDYEGANDAQIRGTILSGDGTVFRGDFLIANRPYADQQPQAVYGGGKWHVSYRSREGSVTTMPPPTIRGVFVSSDGATLTPADVVTSPDPGLNVWMTGGYSNGTFAFVWMRGTDRIEARTMSPAGVLGPIVTAATPAVAGNIVGTPTIYGGANGFLVGWTEAHARSYYRLATTALAFSTAPKLAFNAPYARGAWCATTNEWFLAPSGGIYGLRVKPSGSESATEGLGSGQIPFVAWSPSANVVGVLYDVFNSATQKNDLYFARFGLVDAPGAPSNLRATAGNAKVALAWTAAPGASYYTVRRALSAGGDYMEVGHPTGTFFTDTYQISNGVRYYYRVLAVNSAGVSAPSQEVSAVPSAPSTYPALLVVGNATLSGADTAIRNRLQGLGFGVTVKSGPAATTTDAAGKSVVVISSSVNSGDVNTKFRGSAVPVLVCENALMDDMRMTGTTAGTSYGTQSGQTKVVISNASHPLAAGLSGTVTVTSSAQTFSWGAPSTSAAKVATVVGNTARSTVYGYEKGASMAGLNAPERRVGFLLDTATAGALNANGWRLFDAALRWLTRAPAAPKVWTQALPGQVVVYWLPVSGATTYTIKFATSLNGPWTTVTGVTGDQYTISGLTNGATYYVTVQAATTSTLGAPSAAVTAAPKQDTLAISVTGAARLRRRLAGDPLDTWNNDGYTASVKRDGVEQRAVDLTASWVVDQDPLAGAAAAAFEGEILPKNATIRSLQNINSTRFKYSAAVKNSTAKGDLQFWVHTVRQQELSVIFRWPEDDPGKAVSNPLFFEKDGPNANDSVRRGARNTFATQFQDPANEILKRAGIKIYITSDPALGLKIGGFNAGVYNANGPSFNNLSEKNFAGTINVYVVRQVQFNGKNTGGVTLDFPVRGPKRLTVVFSETSDASNLAHEIGHTLGLFDVEFTQDPTGPLNNLRSTAGAQAARESLLMKAEGRRATLITSRQAHEMFFEASFPSPARKSFDNP